MPLFTPIGGGGIGPASVTATTGSPSVDTTSRPGKTIYKFTNTAGGSITIGTPGTAEVLVVGGGGGGIGNGGGNGGGGGYIYKSQHYLSAGTHIVTVGEGGVGTHYNTYRSNPGITSRLGDLFAIGGGKGGVGSGSGAETGNGGLGGSGGSAAFSNSGDMAAGKGIPGQGYDAGSWNNYYIGGSGGAGGPGGNASSSSNGTAGPGVTNAITGTSITYAAGAAMNSGAGGANTGSGGSAASAVTGHSGGSGIVVVVIG